MSDSAAVPDCGGMDSKERLENFLVLARNLHYFIDQSNRI